jgi:hypothetical protein
MACCRKPADLANLAGGRGVLFLTVALISLGGMRIRTETEFKLRQLHIDRGYGATTSGISRILIKVSWKRLFLKYNIEDPRVCQGMIPKNTDIPPFDLKNQSVIANMCKNNMIISKHSRRNPKLDFSVFAIDPR